jgi:hypothetical protein
VIPPDLTDIQVNLLHDTARQGRMPVKPIAFPVKALVKHKYAQLVKRQGGGFDLILTDAGRKRELDERRREAIKAEADAKGLGSTVRERRDMYRAAELRGRR